MSLVYTKCPLSRSSNDELGDSGTDTDAREVNVLVFRQHANKSLMDLHVHGMPAPPFAKYLQREPLDRPHHLPLQHFFHLVPETAASHEHLLLILSKNEPLPQLQTIQWIPRGLDRRYAAIRLQALDRMQAARANTAAPTQRLWSKMALLIAHLILRVAPGHKQQEEGLGSMRDEIRKRLALGKEIWNSF